MLLQYLKFLKTGNKCRYPEKTCHEHVHMWRYVCGSPSTGSVQDQDVHMLQCCNITGQTKTANLEEKSMHLVTFCMGPLVVSVGSAQELDVSYYWFAW